MIVGIQHHMISRTNIYERHSQYLLKLLPLLAVLFIAFIPIDSHASKFKLMEATISDINAAFKEGTLTS